jgi:phage repressor protein C with HTH and peptisase S24 domain
MAWLFRVRVVGPSMEPVLRNGQICWARKGGHIPGRIAVFIEPGRPDLIAVKRLIRHGSAGWWVEGENSEASTDSRSFGEVPDSHILGTLIGYRARTPSG